MNEHETTPETIATSGHAKNVLTSTSPIYGDNEGVISTSDVDSRTIGENCDKKSQVHEELNTSVASYGEYGDNTYALPKNISGLNDMGMMDGVSPCNLPVNRRITAQPPDEQLESIASYDNEYEITKSSSNKSPQPIVNNADIEDYNH